MRTDIQTLLPIAEWCRIIGVNAWHFAQIGTNLPLPDDAKCEKIVFQSPFQNSTLLSREDIAQGIADAEKLIANLLGYWPAPKYLENERVSYPKNYNQYNWGTTRTPRLALKSIPTRYRWLEAVGTEVLTLVNAGSAVVRADTTGDGLDDEFTVTQTVTAGTDPNDIILFFTAADRNSLPQKNFEIRPLRVSVSGTTATIKGSSYLLVKPDHTLTLNPLSLDADAAATYVTTVDVYTRTIDATDNGTFIWENIFDCDNPPCTVTINTACWGLRDMEWGRVYGRPASWDATNSQFTRDYPDVSWRAPDRVTINYKAGFPLDADTNQMDYIHAAAVAKLATALIPTRACGCKRAEQRIVYYQDLPTATLGGQVGIPETAQTVLDQTAQAFGTMKRGAVEAFTMLKENMSSQGVLW